MSDINNLTSRLVEAILSQAMPNETRIRISALLTEFVESVRIQSQGSKLSPKPKRTRSFTSTSVVEKSISKKIPNLKRGKPVGYKSAIVSEPQEHHIRSVETPTDMASSSLPQLFPEVELILNTPTTKDQEMEAGYRETSAEIGAGDHVELSSTVRQSRFYFLQEIVQTVSSYCHIPADCTSCKLWIEERSNSGFLTSVNEHAQPNRAFLGVLSVDPSDLPLLSLQQLQQCIEGSLEDMERWKMDAGATHRSKLRVSCMYALQACKALHLVKQQMESTVAGSGFRRPGRPRRGIQEEEPPLLREDWLGRFLRDNTIVYKGKPLTLKLGRKLMTLLDISNDMETHWLLHSGLAASTLYNMNKRWLKSYCSEHLRSIGDAAILLEDQSQTHDESN